MRIIRIDECKECGAIQHAGGETTCFLCDADNSYIEYVCMIFDDEERQQLKLASHHFSKEVK